MTVAEKLAICRNNAGMSQRQLAKKSGISSQAINQYESGKRVPDLKCFVAISRALEVSTDQLLEDVAI